MRRRLPITRVRLAPLRRRKKYSTPPQLTEITVEKLPYPFARLSVLGGYLDLSRDGDSQRLSQLGLPDVQNPVQLADWLGLPVGRLAWLVHRCDPGQRPSEPRKAHYHFRWVKKKRGGYRLIEAPKPMLKAAQVKILKGILDKVPIHSACHGFVGGRSILSNALPHTRKRVVVKLDLENFYTTVGYSRVVAIFRSLGYSREVSIWLGALTTSAVPHNAEKPEHTTNVPWQYFMRHLPQGAPTSPALANLSAFSLDLRLSGLSRTFKAQYTRYADDLTFSGSEKFLNSLSTFLPLVGRIIKSERFRLHFKKRQVLRNNQQQKVTGVVVNARPNVARDDYDRLKALLHNCLVRGVSSQNHDHHSDFAAHVLGRIGHVRHLNAKRGDKLLDMYRRIDWTA